MEALAAAAFTAGLLGGVHCAGMCGGIAGALSAAARGPSWARIGAFNVGRIGSYAIAGGLAGALGGLAQVAGPVMTLQAALFVVAHVLVIFMGLYVAGWGGAILRLESVGRGLWQRLEPLRRKAVPIDGTGKAVAAGALWGWIPCGMVYGMLPLAAASGSAASGALVLAAFGLGTLPALVASGVAGARLTALRRARWVRLTAGLAIAALGVVSLARMPAASDLLNAAWACLPGR